MLKPIYLYQIPKGSKIKAFDAENQKDILLTFYHTDGLYSYCQCEDGQIAHLSHMVPLVKKEDYYEIDEPEEKI